MLSCSHNTVNNLLILEAIGLPPISILLNLDAVILNRDELAMTFNGVFVYCSSCISRFLLLMILNRETRYITIPISDN